MGADRKRGVIGLALSLGLLAGCASMPAEGDVTKVDSSQHAEHESRVRVYGVSPQKGQEPQDIVRGFLEATTSDEPDFATAQEYLTRDAAEAWDPFAGTTVLEGGPRTSRPTAATVDDEDGEERDETVAEDGYSVRVSGTRTARLDGRHAYKSADGEFSEDFHLTEVKGKGWRIDRLPDGLVLGESDFERIYRSVDTFYFARLGADTAAVSRGKDVLVAQPVYVRSRIAPFAETIRALLQGPDSWLEPVVGTAFPDGSLLAGDRSVAVDDSGAVAVRLNERAAAVGENRCMRMAAQVYHSVQSQASAKIASVRMQGPRGRQVCEMPEAEAKLYEPGRLGGRSTQPYLIDVEHRVAALEPSDAEPKAVPGPLGSGHVEFRSVGVSRDERRAAAVTRNGRALYVASVAKTEELTAPVLTSSATHEDNRLSAPSWDGLGDVWVADRDPRDPRLLRLRDGAGEPEEVSVPFLGKDERIESLRIASDGVRIALRIRQPDGSNTLQLGRVERGADGSIAVAALQDVAPQLEDVVSVSWSGHSELAVVGRESRSVQQLQYIGTDGSTTHQPPLPGINDVVSVAASEAKSRPLLAQSQYGIVRLPSDDPDWETVTEHGVAPVYPG